MPANDKPTRPFRAVVYGRESQGEAKSIEDQVTLGQRAAAELGWEVVGAYDDGTSASRFATKRRPGWERLVTDLDGSGLDVVVLWETTRGDRRPVEWLTLIGLARERGVLIHVVSDERTYDPRRARDFKDLASAGVDAGYETDRLSERVRRGVRQAAERGRPAAGVAAYGLRSVYDSDSGKLIGQESVEAEAEIVRRIFDQVAASVPVGKIETELAAEGVRTRRGAKITRQTIRRMIRNAVYVGQRVHRRQGRYANGTPEIFPGSWPGLVEPEVWHAANEVLDAPSRTATTIRPGRQVHLLSFLATCHRGHPLRAIKKARYYQCEQGCIVVSKPALDELVEATVVEALADPKIYRRLRTTGESADTDARAARNEAAALRARLKEWRQAARKGTVSPESFAEIEAGLAADIAAAEKRADQVALPPALRAFLEPGADVEERWDAATIQAKRDVIRALCAVAVNPTGRNPRVPIAERVSITPIFT